MKTIPKRFRTFLMNRAIAGMTFADWLNGLASDLFNFAYDGSQEEIDQANDIPLRYLNPRQLNLIPRDASKAVVWCCSCTWQGLLSETDTMENDDESEDFDACPICEDGGSLYYKGVLDQGHTQLALPWSGGARVSA